MKQLIDVSLPHTEGRWGWSGGVGGESPAPTLVAQLRCSEGLALSLLPHHPHCCYCQWFEGQTGSGGGRAQGMQRFKNINKKKCKMTKARSEGKFGGRPGFHTTSRVPWLRPGAGLSTPCPLPSLWPPSESREQKIQPLMPVESLGQAERLQGLWKNWGLSSKWLQGEAARNRHQSCGMCNLHKFADLQDFF